MRIIICVFLFGTAVSFGIQRSKTAPPRYYWNAPLVVEVLRRLYTEGVPISPGNIARDKSKKTSDVIKSVTGRPCTGHSFHRTVCKYYPSYSDALTSAGIGINEVRKYPVYDRAFFKTAILALHHFGLAINPRSLLTRASSSTAKAILLAATGAHIDTKTLYLHILKETGYRYREFLIEIGLDPEDVIRKYPKTGALCSDWMERDRVGDEDSILRDLRYDELTQVIFDYIATADPSDQEWMFNQLHLAISEGTLLAPEFARELQMLLMRTEFEYFDCSSLLLFQHLD